MIIAWRTRKRKKIAKKTNQKRKRLWARCACLVLSEVKGSNPVIKYPLQRKRDQEKQWNFPATYCFNSGIVFCQMHLFMSLFRSRYIQRKDRKSSCSLVILTWIKTVHKHVYLRCLTGFVYCFNLIFFCLFIATCLRRNCKEPVP